MQLSYAIGYPDPLNIWVSTERTTAPGVTDEKLVELIRDHFKLTPKGIIETWTCGGRSTARPPATATSAARRRLHLGEDRQGRRPAKAAGV